MHTITSAVDQNIHQIKVLLVEESAMAMNVPTKGSEWATTEVEKMDK